MPPISGPPPMSSMLCGASGVPNTAISSQNSDMIRPSRPDQESDCKKRQGNKSVFMRFSISG